MYYLHSILDHIPPSTLQAREKKETINHRTRQGTESEALQKARDAAQVTIRKKLLDAERSLSVYGEPHLADV